jgi:hypothetical protein
MSSLLDWIYLKMNHLLDIIWMKCLLHNLSESKLSVGRFEWLNPRLVLSLITYWNYSLFDHWEIIYTSTSFSTWVLLPNIYQIATQLNLNHFYWASSEWTVWKYRLELWILLRLENLYQMNWPQRIILPLQCSLPEISWSTIFRNAVWIWMLIASSECLKSTLNLISLNLPNLPFADNLKMSFSHKLLHPTQSWVSFDELFDFFFFLITQHLKLLIESESLIATITCSLSSTVALPNVSLPTANLKQNAV